MVWCGVVWCTPTLGLITTHEVVHTSGALLGHNYGEALVVVILRNIAMKTQLDGILTALHQSNLVAGCTPHSICLFS